MINKKELSEIIKDLLDVSIEIRKELPYFVLSYEKIFSEACSYQRGFLAGQKKEFKKERDKPTEKQIAFLKKNDYRGDISKLTFLEAKQLISKFIDGKS